MRQTESDSKGPGGFVWFAFDSLSAPDELSLILIPISIVIGVVFGLVWFLGGGVSELLRGIDCCSSVK